MTLKMLFSNLHDPRVDRCKLHLLEDIVMIILCGTMAGAKHYHQIATYATHQQHILKRFLNLSNGIPSKVTLWRVFERLDPRHLKHCIHKQKETILQFLQDGNFQINHQTYKPRDKPVERSSNLLFIQSWLKQTGITIGQPTTTKKNNEKRVIPILLEKLAVPDSFISIDTMKCRKSIARFLYERQADYLLRLTPDNGFLYEQVKDQLNRYLTNCKTPTEVSFHGDELQTRRCFTSTHLEWIDGAENWQGLKSIAVVENRKETHTKAQVKHNYYLCSIAHPLVNQILQLTQSHFENRNKFYWMMDILYLRDNMHLIYHEKTSNLSMLYQFITQACLSPGQKADRALPTKPYPAITIHSIEHMKKILQKLVHL